MIKCPNCETFNDEENQFCGKCGTKLPEPKFCPNCNYESYENEYCTQCGTKLIPKSAKPKKVQYPDEINDKIESLDKFASGLQKNEKYENAIKYYDKILEIDSSNTDALSSKGHCFFMLSKYGEALECYDNLLEINPYDEYCYSSKGHVCFRMGKYDEAIKCYDKLLELNPNYSNAYLYKVDALIEMGKEDDAVDCFKKSLNGNLDFVPLLFEIGLKFRWIRKYEAALKCYDKLLEIKPFESYYLSLKAIVLGRLGKYDDALKFFDKALYMHLNYDYAFDEKGKLLVKMERYDEAIECFKNALEIKQYSYYWSRLASCYYNLKEFDEALRCCDNSIELFSNNFEANFIKANSYFELAEYRMSRHYCKKACEIKSSDELEIINNEFLPAFIRNKINSFNDLKKFDYSWLSENIQAELIYSDELTELKDKQKEL